MVSHTAHCFQLHLLFCRVDDSVFALVQVYLLVLCCRLESGHTVSPTVILVCSFLFCRLEGG